MSDLTARRIAKALEALGESAPAFATFLASYHQSLQAAGFSAEEALQLVIGMQQALLRGLVAPSTDEVPTPTRGPGLHISSDAPRGS